MTLTITLSPQMEAALRAESETTGHPAEEIALEALAERLDLEDAEPDWTPAQLEAMSAGVERGLKDIAEGRFRLLDDLIAEHKENRKRRGTLP